MFCFKNNAIKYFLNVSQLNTGFLNPHYLDHYFFPFYINDLPKIIYNISRPTLFADNTSIIITNSGPSEFKKNINYVVIEINNWCNSNLLSLNFDKTHFVPFVTKNSQENDMPILYENQQINNAKFLRLIIDSFLPWKVHIDELTSKLNKACFVIR